MQESWRKCSFQLLGTGAGQPDYILVKGGGGGGGSYYSHPDGSGPGRAGGSAGGASGGDEPPADASTTGNKSSAFITDYGQKVDGLSSGCAPSGGGGAGVLVLLMVMNKVVAMVVLELPYHNSHMLKLVYFIRILRIRIRRINDISTIRLCWWRRWK